MKRNALRIFATAAAVIALALVIVLIVTTFGGIDVEDFDNSLVKGLIMSMSIAYLALTIVTLIMLFISDESTKEITLRMGQEGNTRITVGVIKKIAKEKAALIAGIKCKKCIIITNEYGVRLKISVSIKGKDAEEAENELRAILVDAYDKILGFKFHSIELKVKKLVPAYKTDVEEVIKNAAIEAEKKKAEEAAAASVEESNAAAEQTEPVIEGESAVNEEAVTEAVEEPQSIEPQEVVEEATEEAENVVAEENSEPEEEEDAKVEVFEENGVLQ